MHRWETGSSETALGRARALLAHHFAEAASAADADLAWGNDPDELARLRAQAVEFHHRGVTVYRRADPGSEARRGPGLIRPSGS
jgi:hypothetical protein